MAGKKKNKIRVTFNAPLTLCFAFICGIVLLADYFTKGQAVLRIFSSGGAKTSAYPFVFNSLLSYLRLFLHIFGSINFAHFVSNFAFILLLGPMLEEKYGSLVLALMMAVTSLVSGVINACFGQSLLVGAGDIAFMMVLLSAFTSFSKNEIPLSFILVLILYIGREIAISYGNGSSFSYGQKDLNGEIRALSNVAGGICGSLFAFLAVPKSQRKSSGKNENKGQGRNEGKKESYDSEEASFFSGIKSGIKGRIQKRKEEKEEEKENNKYNSHSWDKKRNSQDEDHSDSYSSNYTNSGSGGYSKSYSDDDQSTIIGSIDL